MHGFFYNASLSPLAKIPTKTNNFRSISDSDTIQALIHTDNRRFKIPTSNVGPPSPAWQSLSTKSHVFTHDNFAFRKGLIVSGLMHNSPAEAMLACLNPWIFFYPFSPFTHLCKKIEHVILFYLFNRIVMRLEHITLGFDIKRNILYKSKVHYFTLNWCFLFVCLLDCSLDFLIDWLIDWLIDCMARKRGECLCS